MRISDNPYPMGPLSGTLRHKDRMWFGIWITGLILAGVWDAVFLNSPSFSRLQTAFANSMISGMLSVAFSVLLGWWTGVAMYFLETRFRALYLLCTFFLNLMRSVPQIVGVLIGYILLTRLIEKEILTGQLSQSIWMACVVGVFVFQEVADLVRERVAYFSKLDFFQAMLCCGITESRIINREILWKNSRGHLLHKMISIFGTVLFIQCSIDFIVSVGLSTDVSLTNFPATLGNLLAKMDSKQDILAIGAVFSRGTHLKQLFFEHLQGVSVAFVIVWTLSCVYKIANGVVQRLKL